MPKRIIQVPMPDELLKELDAAAERRGESRASVIREACAEYVASSHEAELVRQYIEGYTRMPESDEDEDWGEMGEKELAERLAEDSW